MLVKPRNELFLLVKKKITERGPNSQYWVIQEPGASGGPARSQEPVLGKPGARSQCWASQEPVLCQPAASSQEPGASGGPASSQEPVVGSVSLVPRASSHSWH